MKVHKSNTPLKKNKLSILLSRNGLSFCVLNLEGIVEDFLKIDFEKDLSPTDLLEKIKEQKKYLDNTFQKVSLIYAHELYTNVPQPIFSDKELANYLKFNIQLLPTDNIVYDKLEKVDANTVFIPFTNINNFLVDHFGFLEFKHSSSILIDQSVLSVNENKAYLNFYKNHFDYCIFRGKDLMLSNTYSFTCKEDVLYYVLFALEQLEIASDNITFILSGEIEQDDNLFDLLYQYILNIEFQSNRFSNKILENIDEPYHKNHLLLSNLLCE